MIAKRGVLVWIGSWNPEARRDRRAVIDAN
jgi:hypothetical protein